MRRAILWGRLSQMSRNETPATLTPLKFTVDKQALAVKAMAETGRTTLAAVAAGVCVRTINRYRALDPEGFGKAFTEARKDATALLEAVAWELATKGALIEYFDREGKSTHKLHRVDTRMLKFLLIANDPARYGSKVSVSTTHTEVTEHRVRIDVGSMSQEERAAMRLLCKGAAARGPAVEVVVHPVEGGTP